jgi:hypothetical protein
VTSGTPLFGTADALLDSSGEAWESLETRLREQHQSRLRERRVTPVALPALCI